MIVETGVKGPSVTITEDGVRLNLIARTGRHCSFNLIDKSRGERPIVKQAVRDWCIETKRDYPIIPRLRPV